MLDTKPEKVKSLEMAAVTKMPATKRETPSENRLCNGDLIVDAASTTQYTTPPRFLSNYFLNQRHSNYRHSSSPVV
jgi:hypothetical protein